MFDRKYLTLHVKMTMSDSHHSWHLYQINNVEDIVVFLGLKVINSFMFSCSNNAQITSVEKPQFLIIIVFKMINIDTGCPKKHGNSVTNSRSPFQIILWFSIVIPTENAVICKSFVCYVYILFVYVLTATGCT